LVWIAADALKQVFGLIYIGNHPDVAVVFMARMDCRSYIGPVIAGSEHHVLYRVAKLFGVRSSPLVSSLTVVLVVSAAQP
jgi:hypothetical protein